VLAELNEMLAAYSFAEEHFADVIAYGVNYGMSGKKPGVRRAPRDRASDISHLRKMMRGDAPAEPVQLTPEVVDTVFGSAAKNAVLINVEAPSTLPDEDVAADIAYLRKVSDLAKKALGN